MEARLCHRYGPGRLPYASRRDLGGGIAMAATGLLATVLWYGGTGLLIATGTGSDTAGFFFGVGLFFLPLSILSAFLIGTLLWRQLAPTEHDPRYGALFGGITALGSLVGGSFGPATAIAVSGILDGQLALLEALTLGAVLVPIGVLLAIIAAGWLVVPLGMFGGWYHERANAT